jgi:hypothetical protein
LRLTDKVPNKPNMWLYIEQFTKMIFSLFFDSYE